jgi:hypothetical protein
MLIDAPLLLKNGRPARGLGSVSECPYPAACSGGKPAPGICSAAIEAAGAFSQLGGPLPASHASSFTSAGAVGAPWAGAPWSAPPSCSAGAISMSIDPSEPNDMPLCCIEAG